MNIPQSAFVPENVVSRNGFGSPVRRQPAYLHTQTESGTYLRDSSHVQRRRPFTYLKPPYAIAPVTSLSGHAIAYRWRSLPRVRRPRASKPQGSSERVLPWQVTMEQLICASFSHIQYWYEVGMLKVPAYVDYWYICIFLLIKLSHKLMLKVHSWSQGRKTSSGRENVRCTLHAKRKQPWYKKILGKCNISK